MNITKMKQNQSQFPWAGWAITIAIVWMLGATVTLQPFVFTITFVPMAFGGVYFADWLRRIAYPHTIIYSGFFEALGKKFFWKFGPQLIALFLIYAVIINTCGSKI